MTDRVAVVVLSKDEPQLLTTLEALHGQCDDVGAECIVVDASAGRLDHIRQAQPWVRWVDFVGPLGVKVTIPHQRNAGVRSTEAEIVAFCDAGGRPDAGWLADLVEPIKSRATLATCGPLLPMGEGVMAPANLLPDGAQVLIAITANMAFRREAFDRVGGFDERYRYGSDTDFGFRLLDAGIAITCAANARMRMDWGDTERSFRRARAYGRGNVLLFLTHPRRAWTVIRIWPDTLAYPVWIVGLLLALPLAVVTWWIPVVWGSTLAVPIARNASEPNIGTLFRVKLVRAASFLVSWITVPLHRDVMVLLFPENHENPYLDELQEALGSAGVVASPLSTGPTPSRTLNSILIVPRLLWHRVRGARILHLHWTYDFAWKWALGLPLLRRLPRKWFEFTLWSVRKSGLRIVFTAHNVLPHHQVFDDDVAARRALYRETSQVIALSEFAASRLTSGFQVAHEKVTVIPEGPPTVRPRRDERRSNDAPLLVSFGQMEPYKGPDLLLDAVAELIDEDVSVMLLGASSDASFAAGLHGKVASLSSRGRRVTWRSHRYEQRELDELLEDATWAAFPFREITNSGSLRQAMAHRVVCLLPSLPALDELPREVALWFAANDPLDLARAIRDAHRQSEAVRVAMLDAASAWLGEWSWQRVGSETRAVYDRALEN